MPDILGEEAGRDDLKKELDDSEIQDYRIRDSNDKSMYIRICGYFQARRKEIGGLRHPLVLSNGRQSLKKQFQSANHNEPSIN